MNYIYKLEGIIFDPSLCLLENGELNTKLGYKESAILKSLCEQPLKVIYREELQDTLWQGVIGADTNLNRAIYTLRKKLSSIHSDELDLIQTIPRVGYVLKCSVERLGHQVMSINESTSVELPILSTITTSNNEQINLTTQNFIEQCTGPNSISVMRHLIIYSIFLSGLIGIILWFYYFDNNNNSLLRSVVSNDKKQQLIYDSRVNFDNDTSAMSQLFTLAEKLNINYISVGLNYISIYKSIGNRGIVFQIPANIKNTTSLYELILLLNEKSLFTPPPVSKINCTGVILTKTYNKLCLSAETQIISSDGNIDVLSSTLNYYDSRGIILLSGRIMGTITKLSDRNRIFKFTQFDTILEKMPISINDIKSAAASYLLQGWKYKGQTIRLYKITDHLYFSCAYGGHLIQL